MTLKLIQLVLNPLYCTQIDIQAPWKIRIGGFDVNAQLYSRPFPNFWRSEFRHGADFLTDYAKLDRCKVCRKS